MAAEFDGGEGGGCVAGRVGVNPNGEAWYGCWRGCGWWAGPAYCDISVEVGSIEEAVAVGVADVGPIGIDESYVGKGERTGARGDGVEGDAGNDACAGVAVGAGVYGADDQKAVAVGWCV